MAETTRILAIFTHRIELVTTNRSNNPRGALSDFYARDGRLVTMGHTSNWAELIESHHRDQRRQGHYRNQFKKKNCKTLSLLFPYLFSADSVHAIVITTNATCTWCLLTATSIGIEQTKIENVIMVSDWLFIDEERMLWWPWLQKRWQ